MYASMRKVLSPQRDTMATLAKRGDPRVSERTSVYLRDVWPSNQEVGELIALINGNRDHMEVEKF